MRKIPPPYSDPAPLFRHGGRRPGQADLLDFSTGINPLGPPQSVLRALRKALPDIAHYPDPECRALTAQLAAYHGVSPEMVVVGNGCNELIYAIARAFRPLRVAIAEPTYTEYLRASLLVGAEVDHWLGEGEGFRVGPFDPGPAHLVWLCNPNNPTGQPYIWSSPDDRTGASVRGLGEWARSYPRTVFVVDEASLWFFPSWKTDSLIPHLADLANVIVLRSMTKFYALPGLRLGYAVTQPHHAQRLREQIPPWSVNTLAQVAGQAALADTRFAKESMKWLGEETPYLDKAFKKLSDSLQYAGWCAGSFLLRSQRLTAEQLTSALLAQGILIRDASNFVGLDAHYIRVATRERRDNQRLLAALTSLLKDDPDRCRAR